VYRTQSSFLNLHAQAFVSEAAAGMIASREPSEHKVSHENVLFRQCVIAAVFCVLQPNTLGRQSRLQHLKIQPPQT